MSNPQLLSIIETECQSKDAEEFNRWYNDVHIPMLLKSPGVSGVSRFEIAVEAGQPPRFMAVYKFNSEKDIEEFQKSPQTSEAIKDFNDNWGTRVKLVSNKKASRIKDW
ncbi:MAG: EthD family reductase [Dehalococcoidales bacterium]|nr:EthD family reductase [Dehalococcoidales bacterium]